MSAQQFELVFVIVDLQKKLKMKKLITLLLILCSSMTMAQVNYTAHDQITPYTGKFRLGNNPGYFPNWTNAQLADIAAGNPAVGQPGVGSRSNRVALPEDILDVFGYGVSLPDFAHYASVGMVENVALIGGPTGAHRDYTEFCPGIPSRMFANLYLPIWDGGANGTPYNDDNYFAAYLYKVVNLYKDQVRFWEIWNEPGLDITFNIGWRDENYPGNWFAEGPDPCDNIMHAPIYYYIRTLRISWEIIKTLAPDDYVCIGSVGYQSFMNALLTNTDNPNQGDVTSEYPLTGGAYFDAVSYHSYPHLDGSTAFFDSGFFDRNSDRAADGLINYQNYYKVILNRYGYDGSLYPPKEWIVTEVNSPRKTFGKAFPEKPEDVGPWFGGNNEQVNHMMKTFMIAKVNKIHQLHPYQLIDERTEAAADYEFQLMGMYKNLQGAGPYNVQVNDEGKAMKTMTDLIFETEFDESRTTALNLPQGARGYAWRRSDGSYVYALWARTTIDLSEEASATYSFPSSFNLSTVVKYQWDYGYSNSTQTVSSQNITLDARPVFFTAGSGGDQCFGIGASIDNIQCNNNGTPTNPSDDTFTFSAFVQSSGTCGSGWTSSNGASGSYGVAQTFGPYLIAGGDVLISFRDTDEASIVTTAVARAPAPCSGTVVTSCENNLLVNSGLESGLSGWEGNGQTTSSARSGNNALQVCQNGTNARQTRPAQGGKTYTLQAYAKKDNGANGVIGIKFLSSSWQPLLQQYQGINSNNYALINLNATAPSGTAYVEITMIKDNGSGCVFADDWCLTDGQIVIPEECEISASISTIRCDENGTPMDSSDDIFTFNLTVTQNGECSNGWNTSGTTGSYGVTQSFGPYPISEGIRTFNIVDAIDPQATTSISVTPPAPCSDDGGEDGIDLELTATASNNTPAQWTFFSITFVLNNSGDQNASGIRVQIPMPDGIVLKGGDEYTASQGSYQTFGNFEWNVGALNAGASATITLNYFNLSSGAVTIFGQVSAMSGTDSDSTPNNNATTTPNEDDEAAVTINANAAPRQGLTDFEHNQYFKILNTYPTITKDELTIILTNSKEETLQLKLYDAAGRVIIQQTVSVIQGINEIILDASPYQSGMYHILIQPQKGKPLTTRFIKQRL